MRKQGLIQTAVKGYGITEIQAEALLLAYPNTFFKEVEKFTKKRGKRSAHQDCLEATEQNKIELKQAKKEGFISTKEAGVLFDKTSGAVRKWIPRYNFQSKKIGRSIYVNKEELVSFFKRRKLGNQ